MRTKIMFLAALAVGFLLPLTSFAQTPQAETEQPLVNPVMQTIKGVWIPSSVLREGNLETTVPASCRFTLALPPGQKAIEARRISEINIHSDDNTCDALFEVGEPPVESLMSSAESENLANTSSVSSTAVSMRTDELTGDANQDLDQPAPAKIQSAGFLKTWWIDPINITLNSVQNSTTWHWSGTGHCVTGVSGGQHLTWFTLSGWEKLSDHFKNTFTCKQSTSASTVLYDNPIFCAGVDTYAFYNPNMVNGLQNGTLLGTWNDSFYGSLCVYLARFRMHLERTQN